MRMRDTFLKPMHPEGRRFVAIFAAITVALFLISEVLGWITADWHLSSASDQCERSARAISASDQCERNYNIAGGARVRPVGRRGRVCAPL